MHIAVYCASSNHVDDRYFGVARDLGHRLAQGGHTLVYGGGNVGLMGALARATHAHGGTVVGVIPTALKEKEGVAYDVADEMIVTDTMQERKRIIYTRADAFIVLPGGFGTLEEFLEVLTLKQLGYHAKPIMVVNTGGYYDALQAYFSHLVATRFARPHSLDLYYLAPDPGAALDHLNGAP